MVQPVSHLSTLAGLLSLSAAASLNWRELQSTTPSVDLGYEIHTATVNVTSTCRHNNLEIKLTFFVDDRGLLHIQQRPLRPAAGGGPALPAPRRHHGEQFDRQQWLYGRHLCSGGAAVEYRGGCRANWPARGGGRGVPLDRSRPDGSLPRAGRLCPSEHLQQRICCQE